MKLNQVLNGYRVVTRPTNADAGKCLWAFAEKGGGEFFIKEFLDPKIPKADSMGTVEDKERRFAECERFAKRHTDIMAALRADDVHAGNLVLAVDFFAVGTRYYKVTPRVRPADAAARDLDTRGQLVLLKTLVDSLVLLHAKGIVHGDLKPENILLTPARKGSLLVAKLIDFDDAYQAGAPPMAEVIGGNPLYGAPEWLRYLRGDQGAHARSLTQAADVFAVGLLIHTYLFGVPPGYGEGHESPAAAVLAGAPLAWDSRLGGRIRRLLESLTAADHRARPVIADVAAALDEPDVLVSAAVSPSPPPVPPPSTPPPGGGARTSRVLVNTTKTAARTSSARLRINLTDKN
ncbi:protein kinase domain-containing protein [Actinokineospora inagensis]|uniref:protein kinase domain-containing protein n=1 Tax=Actinokineospora inagensis TaxID=103730 RepID=UPI0004103E7A|nr:phosphotransferase [Actinokineospora inagensis]